jgi:hypothetical protein
MAKETYEFKEAGGVRLVKLSGVSNDSYKSYGHLDTLVLTDRSIRAASQATEDKTFPEHAGKVKFL